MADSLNPRGDGPVLALGNRSDGATTTSKFAYLEPRGLGALKALDAKLRAGRPNIGIVSDNGTARNPAPAECHIPGFENNYDIPEDSLIIPHDFLPGSFAPEVVRKYALRFAASPKEDDVSAMAEAITSVQKKVVDYCKGKIDFLHAVAIKQSEIYHEGKHVENKTQLWKAWNDLNPDEELIAKVHRTLYNGITTADLANMTFQVYLMCGLWLDHKANDGSYLSSSGLKRIPRKCSISTIITNKARDMTRNRYSKPSQVKHGLMLYVSAPKAAKMGRRKKGDSEFDFPRYVGGWKGDKHISYCRDKGYKIPSIKSLEDESAEAIQRIKRKTVDIPVESNYKTKRPKLVKGQQSISTFVKPRESSPVVLMDVDRLTDDVRDTDNVAHATPSSTSNRTKSKEVWSDAESESDSDQDIALMCPLQVTQAEGNRSVPHSKSQDLEKIDDALDTKLVLELKAMLYRQQQDAKDREEKLLQKVDTLKKNQVALTKHLVQGAKSTQELNDSKVGDMVKNISKQKKAFQISATKVPKPKGAKGEANHPTPVTTNGTQKKLSAESAPDEVHQRITQFGGFRRAKGNIWQVDYVMASSDPKYEDLTGMTKLDVTFQDCEHEAKVAAEKARKEGQDDGAEFNLLVNHIKHKRPQAPIQVARIVAGFRKVELLDLFPAYKNHSELKEQSKQGKASKLTSETIKIPKTCSLCTHDKYLSYLAWDYKVNFLGDNNFSDAQCRCCSHWYMTERNLSENRKNTTIPIPTQKKPAYICPGMYGGKSHCAQFICFECHRKLSAEDTSTQRSGRSNKKKIGSDDCSDDIPK